MKKIFMLGIVFALFTATAFAQKSYNAIQHKRIHNGFQSHQLTRGEKFRLQKNQAHYRHEKRKAVRDGKVTPHERRKLNAMRMHNNRETFRMKHNFRKRVI